MTKTVKKPRTAAPPADPDAALTRRDVAALLRCSLTTFKDHVAARKFPGPDFYIGDSPRWRRSTYRAWVDSQCRRTG